MRVTLLKKETLAQVFSYKFCEISMDTFSYRTPLVAASHQFISSKSIGQDTTLWLFALLLIESL